MTKEFSRVSYIHPLINQFWKNFFNMSEDFVNHSPKPQQIAIDLDQFVSVCERIGFETASAEELAKVFKRNKFHNNYRSKVVRSRINHWPLTMLVFNRVDVEMTYLSEVEVKS